jgi:hypothetical protein
VNEVQSDFRLATAADIVADPSAPNAWVDGIMEGVEFWYDKDGRLHKEEVAIRAKKEIEEYAFRKKLNEENMLKAFGNYMNSLVKQL